MFKLQLYALSELVCKWIHPAGLIKISINFEIFILTINKAQELAIVINKGIIRQYEMNLIANFSFRSILGDQDQFYYFEVVLITLFFVHLTSTIMFLENFYNKKTNNQAFSYKFLHNYLLYYTSIFYTPVLYSSLRFFYEFQYCHIKELCFSQNNIFILLICIFNIINCMVMKFVHIYFARSCSIMGDNNILQLQSSFILNLLQETIVFISICLKIFNLYDWIRLIFICLKQFLSMTHQLNKVNCKYYALFKAISISTIISLYYNLDTCEYFLLSSFSFFIVITIIVRLKNFYIFNSKVDNLIIVQIIEEAMVNLNNQQNLLNILMIFRNHNCIKCQSLNQMSQCCFQKVSSKSKNKEKNLLYCEYLSEKFPIQALIRILNVQSSDIYFNGAKNNLINFLKNQSQYMLSQFQRQAKFQKLDEQQNQLCFQDINNIFELESLLFPLFRQIITNKISFLNHQIRGYQNLLDMQEEAMQLSKLMLQCSELMNEKFDLSQFRQKGGINKEVISMRIIQLFFTVVYNNLKIGQSIERLIEEILANERLKGVEPFSSTQMIENKIFIFQSSLLKNRGKFINLDTKKLANFFNSTENDIQGIDHCEQIMPNFIGEIHDTLINRYIKKGFTILQVQSQQTFLKNIEGYLEQCVLNLMSYYDIKNNDFIMNALISKIQSQESIIFGVDGVILGCTQTFFQQVIRQSVQQSKNHKVEDELTVQSFLEQKPLIQYFISNIVDQIAALQEQYNRTQSLNLNNLNATWVIPKYQKSKNISSKKILQKFRGLEFEDLKSNYPIKEIQGHSNPQNLSLAKQESIFYCLKEHLYDELKQAYISDIPIVLLYPELQNSIFDSSELCDYSMINQVTMQYDITFHTFQFSKIKIGYFQLSIKDYQIKENKFNNIQQNLSIKVNDLCNSKQGMQIQTQSQEIFTNYVVKENEEIKTYDENKSFDRQQQQINIKVVSDTQLDQGRNQISLCCNQIVNFSEEIIDHPENSKQILINKQRQELLKKQNKFDINTQQIKAQQPNDFCSNHSKISTDSFEKTSQLLVDQFCYKKQMISPIKNILFFAIIGIISILISIILNYFIIKTSIEKQTDSVLQIINPQNITYFYCSVLYQLLAIELNQQNIIPLSEFQKQRNLETIQAMLNNGRVYIKQLNIIVPQFFENYGIHEVQVKYYDNKQHIDLLPIEAFYQMIYERTEIIYRANINQEKVSMKELQTNGFLRENIIQMFEQINGLIQLKINDSIIHQDSLDTSFEIYIIIQLIISIIIFCCQIKFWLLFDKIKKKILVFILQLNEQQATSQILKLQKMKHLLEDNQQKWKIRNTSEIMLNDINVIQYFKAPIKQQKSTKKFKSETPLSQRIKKNKFYSKYNYIILIIAIISWSLYLITSFLIYSQLINNFQPSLIATLKYGQFKTKMDITSFLGGLIKFEEIYNKNSVSQINQSSVVNLFVLCKNDLMNLIMDISETILENANKNNKVSRFDNFLNGNICLLRQWSDLKACDPSLSNLTFTNKDSIHYLLQSGILGYTAALTKFINSNYDFEIQNQYYNSIDQNKEEINTKQFQNFFLSYFCDTQDTLIEFLHLFKLENTELAAQIVLTLELYYFVFGFSYLIVLFIVFLVLIYSSQRKVMLLRQLFALIPCELMQHPNFNSKAKLIYSWLY